MRSFLLAAIAILLTTFSKAQEQADSLQVAVIEKTEKVPENAQKIGAIKVGDAMGKKCDYETTLLSAKTQAAQLGGNLIHITQVRVPSELSNCYRMHADVFHVDDVNKILQEKQRVKDSTTHSLIADTAQYALLYIYRQGGPGALISINVHLGDSVIARVGNNSRHIIKLYKEGHTNIWSRTETRAEVPIDISFGKVYFLRAAIEMGVFVGEPSLDIVKMETGLKAFNGMKGKIQTNGDGPGAGDKSTDEAKQTKK